MENFKMQLDMEKIDRIVRQGKSNIQVKNKELENYAQLVQAVDYLKQTLKNELKEKEQLVEENERQQTTIGKLAEKTTKLEEKITKLEEKLAKANDRQEGVKCYTPQQIEDNISKAINKVFGVLLRYSSRWRSDRKEAAYNVLNPLTLLDFIPQETKDRIEALADYGKDILTENRQVTINNYDIHDNQNVNQ